MRAKSRIQRSSALAVLAVACLSVPAARSSTSATPAEATPVRKADATCAQCHGEIYRSYVKTPMAKASGLASEHLRPTTFVHAASGVSYTIADAGGRPTLSFRGPEGSGKELLEYSLGSGHLGVTYLYSIGKYLFESPIAWYAPSGSYDMKPGLAPIRQMPPPLPMESGCMRCHMSAVQHSDAGTVNRYAGLPFLHTGITCEECHGDTQQHVLTKGKAGVVNPVKLDANRRDSVCISCHLEGDVSVARAGESPVDYHPGEPISKYLSYYVHAGENLTTRGVSEVEQLSQSTCKRMSGDKMSCMSCHDPHYTPDAAHRVEFYRSKCLACHSGASFAQTHHPENRDCTSCHMPRAQAKNILHVAWTDHRILRIPSNAETTPSADDVQKLVPIFSPGATDRDLAMAYYQSLLEGDRELEGMAWKDLNQEKNEIDNDAAALDALGNMCAERGDNKDAEKDFRRVLALEPEDATALSNLGVLMAKKGDLKSAISYLRSAFERNQDLPGFAMNLARVECMAGDTEAARGTLESALSYSANFEETRQLLDQMTDCRSKGQSGTTR
jgi:tetratricopeptide (TPR) repeat protein